eukprot:gb/GEZN01018169.1/.p2 GENE.gb/GEZN01018169.1/~~gb/GEZN01018169.1/.p2  ORF type:complete len:122 (-),score=10.38 gb/GEZN01018169.1/:179-544(-)
MLWGESNGFFTLSTPRSRSNHTLFLADFLRPWLFLFFGIRTREFDIGPFPLFGRRSLPQFQGGSSSSSGVRVFVFEVEKISVFVDAASDVEFEKFRVRMKRRNRRKKKGEKMKKTPRKKCG